MSSTAMAASCRDLDILWKEHFRDAPQSWDNRSSKKAHTDKALPVDGSNPGPFQLCTSRKAQQDWMDAIQACGRQKNLRKAAMVHAEILKTGLLKSNIFIGTALVRMYAKCGALAKAQEVFDGLLVRDTVTWNALIAGYAQHGLGEEALTCLRWMRGEGFSPNAVTFLSILKACGSIGAIKEGEEIHAEVRKMGLLEIHGIMLGTALVDMYAKCCAVAKAQEVFDGLPVRNVVTWNALITGYAHHGSGKEALNRFELMRDEGVIPDMVTFVCILTACGSMGAIEKGREIHAEVNRLGLLAKDEIVLGNALVNMYAKCGALIRAREVFDELPIRNTVSWNALIGGYAQQGLGEEALDCFGRMQDEGFSPDAVTFVCILKACGSIGAHEKGKEIHAELRRLGLLENHDIVLGNALLNMYVKCGALTEAQKVFDGLPVRDAVSWNVLITGYAENGLGEEALKCFEWMRDDGFSPTAVTFTSVLKACSILGTSEKGEEIHAEVRRLGLLDSHDIVLGTALVDMYSKCGALAKAQEVFDTLPVWDSVSWNSLIAGYVQHGFSEEALKCFGQMRAEGFSPDASTFVCVLTACGSIGATEKGKEIHAEVHRLGLLENHETILGNALVNMYAKCGALVKAQEVFDELSVRDVVTWNALMAGYARLGKARQVFDLFSEMRGECIEPDRVTFSVLLMACSHAGLMEEGQMYFNSMSTIYSNIPSSEHHSCLVDLFSRAGHFDQAISVIEKVPDSGLWLALLGACRKWVNVELGRWAFEHILQLDDKCAAAYVCMSNIYAAAGMEKEADEVEALSAKNGAWEIPRHSWSTDVGGNVHSFTMEDTRTLVVDS